MTTDPNFQYHNVSATNACYLKYQNGVLLNPTARTNCRQWEYSSFCTDVLNGRSCILATATVDLPLCVPIGCTEADFPAITTSYLQLPTTSTVDCTLTVTASPVVAAVISTVAVILITGLVVYVMRPPRDVRESAKFAKAQRRMVTLSESGSSSNGGLAGSNSL